MEFRNHTPFPALAFEGIDQHNDSFHVAVLRQTLTWDEQGVLSYADEQTPLCEVDTFFGEMNTSSVRQESDLCQYKPKCDVIVNATAYAPQGKPHRRFDVRLTVRRPDIPAPLPERPQGLNQFMDASPEEMHAWRAAVEHAKRNPLPGTPLLDKTLTVTGPRSFLRQGWLLRTMNRLLIWGTFGLFRPIGWRLTNPAPMTHIPLRSEYAFGGQCRVNNGDKATQRIAKQHRITPEQLSSHPDASLQAEQQPAAHTAFALNPIGRGFMERWYLKATGATSVAAPQIEDPHAPLTLQHFKLGIDGKLSSDDAARLVTGLGVRPKGHPDRAKLVGTVDDAFVKGDAWLPKDFDFAVWNAAPADQQTDFLKGDEVIELTNLCPPDLPGTKRNASGDTVLKLTLPRHECFLLVRLESGEMFMHPLAIDTVIVEPDDKHLILVWRTVLAKDEDVSIRAVDAHMHTFDQRDALRKEIEQIKTRLPEPTSAQNLDTSVTADEVLHG